MGGMKKKPIALILAKSIPASARWITVHPNGEGSKGTPVLVQETQHGSGVFHVVGGAGGKLNYMKLRGIKPESDYKKDLAERSAQRRQIDKQQRARDKELGLSESKAQARQKVQQQEKDARKQFVAAVGQALGWKPEETGFDEAAHASLSDEARAAVREKHESALFERAKAAVEQSKQVLVTKAQERPEAGLGGVALDETAPDKLDVSDIAPVAPEGSGLGFAPKFAEEAKKSGLTDEERKQEAEAARLRANPDAKPREPKPATGRKEVAERVAQELATVREEAPTPSPAVKDAVIEAAQAAEVLKAAKALKATQRQAKQAKKEIDKATAEPKAYNITYTIDDAAGRQAEADVADSVRTARTRAFLSQVQELAGDDPEKSIGRHLGVGAYNAINAAALAITGDSLVDRLVVDVLGVEGAANVLARRLHSAFPDRVEELTGALQDYHVDHYMKASEEAISEARDLVDTAKEIQLGAAHDGLDLAAMIEINRRRGDALGEAKRVLGTTLGEMEANAALGVAMQAPKASVEVPLNDMSTEDAITRARAIGLKRGDYTVDTVAGKRVLTVNAEGLDRLSKPVDRASLEQVKRNLEIISGTHDEPNWLPLGFARRDDLDNPPAPGAAPQLAEPFKPGPDLQQSLRDYIGGRMADGDAPGDIVADIQSQAFFEQAGDSDAYRAALDAVAPLKSDDGKMVRPEDHQGRFEGYADDFVGRRYGGEVSPLHRQNFEQGHAAQDALHRALAEHPSGVAAFKPIGELTPQDQRALRDHFYKHLGREDEHGAALRQQLEDLDASPPERETTDMFGETTENPEWTDWKQRRDGLAEEVNKSSFTWPKYVEAMHGTAKAYEAMQDLIRSNVAQTFQKHYNTLNPGKPLKLGKTVVRNNLNHLDAVDPDAREERAARERSLVDSLRERSAGRYAEGAVSDKLDAAREQRDAFEQSQMGFFASEDLFGDDPGAKEPAPLAADERYTLGHAAERSLAGLMPVVGENFKPGAPVKLFNPSMSGQFAAQQRAIKYLDANKRMAAALGVGSGKTSITLGGFSHLHGQGKIKKGIFAVPSIVQGQFHAEALRFLEPGKFKWHAQPGASREERIAAYKDPGIHFSVVTHASLRDDMIHLGAKHAGIPEAEMADKVRAMSRSERKDWMRKTCDAEGINWDYMAVDEGHDLLNRAGKEDSILANVADSISDNAAYYINASGDPVKNDVSEAFDLLSKMEPARYTDRAAFMRRYGVDTAASKEALRREMARYVFPHKIEPKVRADKQERHIKLSDGQQQALKALDMALGKARLARMRGKVDVDAVKAISPDSFADVPDDQHEALARNLMDSVGILKETAQRKIIDDHPQSAKLDDVSAYAAERKGKPGVVFAHSRAAVEHITKRLQAEGHRVVTITGSDSAKEKDAKRLKFRPEQGEAEADILVLSDAGAVGLNAQRGQWMYQYDSPATAKTHAQRNGRIHRMGQVNDVELADAIADHPSERRARDRLKRKYELRDIMTSPLEGLDDTGLAFFLKRRQAEKEQGGLF